MELHHLRCAVAIADHGTFTEAAAALHVSQPALSHAVARLERELGVRLFERSTVRTRLTAAGTAFLTSARRALAEVENSRAAVDAVAGVLSGELRVAGVQSAVIETAHLVVEFHQHHPGINVVIEEPTGDRGVIDAVRSGSCDIGVIHSSEQPRDLPGVTAGAQDIVAIFPTAIAPRSKTVTMEFLSGIPIVAPLLGTGRRSAHDAFFRNHAKRPLIVAECADYGVLMELVRGGVGAVLMSESRVSAVDFKGLAVRPLRPQIRTELTAIRRPQASPAAEAFCQGLLHTSPSAH